MGMMLRRRSGTKTAEATVNGKPVPNVPKRKKLNSEPNYPETRTERHQNVTTLDDLVRR